MRSVAVEFVVEFVIVAIAVVVAVRLALGVGGDEDERAVIRRGDGDGGKERNEGRATRRGAKT
jgi:hypothetical protein